MPPDQNSGAAGTVFSTNVALRELGHEVDAVWQDDLGRMKISHDNLHALLELPGAYRRATLKRLSQKRYDVIQISRPQAWLTAASLKRQGFDGLVINRSHGLELRHEAILPAWHTKMRVAESRSPALTWLLRRLLDQQWPILARHCDGVIVGCEMERRFLLDHIALDESRVRAIAHGVSDVFVNQPLTQLREDRERRILHVGQFAFFKGSYLLTEIINNLLKREPDVTFTWVCSAAHHGLIRARLNPEICNRVTLLDLMPAQELMKIYDDHGLFVFPSLCEGFGKAAVEAMARGLCVVASDEGGMHDWIESGTSGWLCDVGNVEQFVQKLIEMIRAPELARRIGDQAVPRGQDLTWARCASGMQAFYATLFAARRQTQ